jgi:hypothetical protein
MSLNKFNHRVGISRLLAFAATVIVASRVDAGSLSFSVDLRTGVADRTAAPYITIKDPPVDANRDGWYETVLRINLNDPKLNNPYSIAEFRVEYDADPTGEVNLDIGDSATNDSGGGDAGTQSNDAEINIGNAEGHTTELFVFGKDGSGGLLGHVPGLVGKSVVVTFTVSNGRVTWRNDRGASGSVTSPSLFALDGQPDGEGPVNYDIYAAFNRAIAGPYRFGRGVSRVTVTLSTAETRGINRTRQDSGGRSERARPSPSLHRDRAVRESAREFRAAVGYPIGGIGSGVAVADLDGDGKPDLASANRESNCVDVFLNKGDGAFGASRTYGAGRDPFTAAVADLNGDGKLDLVTPNRLSNDVTVLLGRGDGTFGAPVAFAAGQGPEDVAVADLNGDGKLDLAVADIYGNSVSMLPGRGDGTFGAPTTLASGGHYTRRVVVADLNRDGKLDLVTASYQSPKGVSIFLGRGDGAFGAPTTYSAGSGATGVAVGDLDRDGKLDLAVANQDSNGVSVLLGRGDGTFGVPNSFASGKHPNMVVMADLDGDGKLDLATADHVGNSVSVLHGYGDGTFEAPTAYAVGKGPADLVVADLNGDGRLDIVTADLYGKSVTVLRGVSPRLAKYFDLIDRYTSPTAATLPRLETPRAEREALRRQIKAFVTALDRGDVPEPLVLSGDDLNALLVPAEGEGQVHFAVERDRLKGQVSLPLGELGLPGLDGRYLNAAATFRVSLRQGVLIIAIASAEVNGRPLPEQLLSELRDKNLAESFARQPEVAAGLDKLKGIRIKDGKVIVEAKPNWEHQSGLHPSTTLRQDQAARPTTRKDTALLLEAGLCSRPRDEAATAELTSGLLCMLGSPRCGVRMTGCSSPIFVTDPRDEMSLVPGETWARKALTFDNRSRFQAAAESLVTIPPSNHQILVLRLDVMDFLRNAGTERILIVSSSAAVVFRGETLKHGLVAC